MASMSFREKRGIFSKTVFLWLTLALFSAGALAIDTDGDGVDDSVDAFPNDACASVDTDGDGMPDHVICTSSLETTFSSSIPSPWISQGWAYHSNDGGVAANIGGGTRLEITVTASTPTALSFDYYVTNDSNFTTAKLLFYDGAQLVNTFLPSHNSFTYTLQPGTHVLAWNAPYTCSDYFGHYRCTYVYIDNVSIVGNTTLVEDADDDNDGVLDVNDKFPLNPAASVDTDLDGFPSSWNASCDLTCQTNSGLALDNCPLNANANQLNTDGDTQGDACDADDDNDGVLDINDAFPLNASESIDTDNDGTGNNADTDDDNDGVLDANDKFPLDATKSKFVRHDNNADGDSDVLVRSTSTGAWTSYAVQNGVITANAALNIPTNSDTQYVAQLDANGDGDADILTRSASTGAWTIHQMQNGAVIASAPIYIYANLVWHFVGVGDFNGDGTDDVLLRSNTTGYYNVFLINNYAVTTVNTFNAWSSPLSVDQGIGDFDGDGTDDLLIRRTTENAWFVFRSVNGLVQNYYCACNLWYNPDWTFQFAGDTNNDGTDDITVRGTGATGDGFWWTFRMSHFMSTQVTNLNLFKNKTAVTLGAVGDYNGDGTIDVLTRVNNATTYVSPIVNGLVPANNWLQNFTTDQVIQK